MLKLQKLELRGFKSFCDFTELTFNEAVTGVVGPNGCGKSNIVDAMAWVLGEQSARLLRGTRMEDVIFQGTSARPAVGLAEVSLAFRALADVGLKGDRPEEPAPEEEEPEDERPGLGRRAELRIQAGDVVAVSRRLYRSGESEYLINGRQVRLRDVRDLFAGTGLGPGHYAIIGQGHVTEIVTAKPYERRTMIEEAAGISKFKLRQHAVELRLESTRQNLIRLEDLFSELDRQIGSLKRQAAKARRFGRLKEEQRSLLRILFVEEHRSTGAAIAEVTSQLETLELQRKEGLERLAELESGLRAMEEAARTGEQELGEARNRLAGNDLELEKLNARRLQVQEQIHGLETRRGDLERETSRLLQRAGLVGEERTRNAATLDQLRVEAETEQEVLASRESELGREGTRIRDLESDLESLRAAVLEQLNRLSGCRNRLSQIEDHDQRLQSDLRRLEAERERSMTRRDQLSSEVEILGGETAELKGSLAAQRELLESLRGELRQSRGRRDSLLQTRAEREREFIAAEGRLNSLVDLEARHARYTQAVQTLFETIHHRDEYGFRLLGTLADYARVEPRHEKLIESYLGEVLQAVVVPTLDDAAQAARLLESEGAGRAYFLVAGVQGAQEQLGEHELEDWSRAGGEAADLAGGVRRVIDLLHLPEHLSAMFSEAYPEMAFAQIVGDLPSAVERSASTPKTVFVTADGEWTRAGRILVGGGEQRISSGLLAVKREITELKARTELQREALELIAREGEVASADVLRLESEIAGADTRAREIDRTLLGNENRLGEIERDQERVRQQLSVIEFESGQAEKLRAEIDAARAAAKDELSLLERDLDTMERSHRQCQTELAAGRGAYEQLVQALSERRSGHSARLERLRALELECARLEREDQDLRRRLEQGEHEIARLSQESSASTVALREIETLTAGLLEKGRNCRAAVEAAEAGLQETYTALDANRTQVEAARAGEQIRREEQGRLEIRRAELAAALRYLAEDCWKELAQRVEELAAEAAALETDTEEGEGEGSVDVTSLKEHIEDLRQKIEELGPVNMMAVDELQELEDRSGFIEAQRQDILDSIASTEQALEEIKRRSRERFREAFEQINNNFQQTFQELFGGGHGVMNLLDPDHILESGIDIVAQPPGKRLQNILLLSGGEKSMTAIALLLAIFRYRPSPFCVLDEVDAQLDDMNVERFSQKIGEMSRSTQFIVITHNKETMEAAQVLHGVTMEEPGVSKLLSVRLK
ncbi:MAG: chromosome segregation protein SMC [Acidobacteria bacterium]|nr:chromosome segregation protein SMC [Acidobacteriota bacterium]